MQDLALIHPSMTYRDPLSLSAEPQQPSLKRHIMKDIEDKGGLSSYWNSSSDQGLHSASTLSREVHSMSALIDWVCSYELQSLELKKDPEQAVKDYKAIYSSAFLPAGQAFEEREKVFRQFMSDKGTASQSLDSYDHEAWEKILSALKDERWDFRTVEGIARETGLDAGTVQDVLKKHEADVRKSPSWRNPGQVLYTSRSRRMTVREILADLQAFAGQTF